MTPLVELVFDVARVFVLTPTHLLENMVVNISISCSLMSHICVLC